MAALLAAPLVWAGPGDARVSARLLADVRSIQPAQPFKIGVLLNIQPGWHIYWKNPGDSGMATRVTLQLPPGLSAGPAQYPTPTFLNLPGDILNYAYENQVMLIVPVTPTAGSDRQLPAETDITATVRWLVCKDICLPGSATVSLKLPVSTGGATSVDPLFSQWEAKMPQSADPANVAGVERSLEVHSAGAGMAGHGSITVTWKKVPADVQWFPGPADGFDVTDPAVSTADGRTVGRFKLAAASVVPVPKEIDCVLAYSTADGQRHALDVPLGTEPHESPLAQRPPSP